MKKELLKQSHHVLISVTRTQTTGVSEPGGADINQPYLNQGKGGRLCPSNCIVIRPLPPQLDFQTFLRPWTKKNLRWACNSYIHLNVCVEA